MIHIDLSRVAEGVARKQALSWWWDFTEGTHDHRFLTMAPERRVRPLEDGEVLVEDTLTQAGIQLWHERLVARLDGYTIAFEGENSLSRFAGTYRFEKTPEGTRVHLDADVHLRPGVAWGQVAARPIVETILTKDLEGHVDHMVEELA